MKRLLTITISLLGCFAQAQISDTISLNDVEVSARRQPIKSSFSVENREVIGKGELFRAACCNLGESFTTNPSVDVSYSDAATGARQIKLLGLSGTYVQMLQENVPAFRGAAIPYALGYVPGPWMQSIQVSKGAASVKNGYESVTGQINIEYLKPQGIEGVHGNLYYDSNRKLEANADGAIHLNENLSTSLLLHFEDTSKDHDGNKDGFMDMPKVRAYNLMDRWAWVSSRWISQLSVRYLHEERTSGVSGHSHLGDSLINNNHSHGGPYRISLETDRVEGQWKNALFLRTDKNESVALMLKGVYHDMNDVFGAGGYEVTQKNAYAQLMYEVDLNQHHNLSVGASVNHDDMDEYYQRGSAHSVPQAWTDRLLRLEKSDETTAGAYAQYTYKIGEKFVAMAGLRYDYSSVFDGFFTPRLHLKYAPSEVFALRVAVGKGYRTSHPLAENVSLMASSRIMMVDGDQLVQQGVKTRFNQNVLQSDGTYAISSSSSYYYSPDKHSDWALKQEEAWNMGASLQFNIPLSDNTLALNADYYYTNFLQQTVIDLDQSRYVSFYNLPKNGKSYSHVFQVDATYPIYSGLSLTLAYRYQDVKATQYTSALGAGSSVMHSSETQLRTRPLTSRYKALATASWKSPLELWQVDVTFNWNGSGRLPDPGVGENGEALWKSHYKAFGQLQAQITREFRLFSVYVGGENLTGFKQKHPIIDPTNPYGTRFDASMVWGPTDGAMVYGGVRFTWEKF
ncbi:MAG: TonB-dependent receptor [Bacteroidales bacterium]|nr:TonB-dependent receptor [Bacteroidales bacterium]